MTCPYSGRATRDMPAHLQRYDRCAKEHGRKVHEQLKVIVCSQRKKETPND
jgi:hypothetical protein